MKNSGSVLLGIVAAATAGVIIGMLIAPQKGEDLRKNIMDKAGDWSKKLADMVSEEKDNVKASMDEELNGLRNETKGAKG